MSNTIEKRQKIKYRIRKKISGTASRPRLAVYKSNSEIYCQLIDDNAGNTLCAASTKSEKSVAGTKTEKAKAIGSLIAKKAVAMNIKDVVFDRGGFLYHGRIKALAESAREGGLNF